MPFQPENSMSQIVFGFREDGGKFINQTWLSTNHKLVKMYDAGTLDTPKPVYGIECHMCPNTGAVTIDCSKRDALYELYYAYVKHKLADNRDLEIPRVVFFRAIVIDVSILLSQKNTYVSSVLICGHLFCVE